MGAVFLVQELAIAGTWNTAASAAALGSLKTPRRISRFAMSCSAAIHKFQIARFDQRLDGRMVGALGRDLARRADAKEEPLFARQGNFERSFGCVADFHESTPYRCSHASAFSEILSQCVFVS